MSCIVNNMEIFRDRIVVAGLLASRAQVKPTVGMLWLL